MSTNFYQRPKGAAEFDERENHIGLSTAPLFMFQAHESRQLTSFKAWMTQLQTDGLEIVDEYARVHTLEQFAAVVGAPPKAARHAVCANSPVVPAGGSLRGLDRYRDEDGHLFYTAAFS